MHSPLHCCNLSPKAGTSQLRYRSVPVGFGAGVRDAFFSAKVSETRKGADFRLVFFSTNSIWDIAEKAQNKKKNQGWNCDAEAGARKEWNIYNPARPTLFYIRAETEVNLFRDVRKGIKTSMLY